MLQDYFGQLHHKHEGRKATIWEDRWAADYWYCSTTTAGGAGSMPSVKCSPTCLHESQTIDITATACQHVAQGLLMDGNCC